MSTEVNWVTGTLNTDDLDLTWRKIRFVGFLTDLEILTKIEWKWPQHFCSIPTLL